MSFRVSQKTLERLEWPRILALLAERCRTPGARALCADSTKSGAASAGDAGEPDAAAAGPPWPFETSEAGARERQSETSEARALLDAGEVPPLAGVRELGAALARAERGGVLSPSELLDVAATLGAIEATGRFLEGRSETAPRLAELGGLLAGEPRLAADVTAAIDPGGEVRDAASRALASARREANGLAGELQRRLARTLQDPDVKSHLSDEFYTVRNDRYVLPVRADARGRVPGIVHDASGSGTTLFIEPQAVVELNNRLRQAELDVERETLRVLRDLSGRVTGVIPGLRADLATLEGIDLAFARGRLSQDTGGTPPELGREGRIALPQLRHPLIPADESVPNDLHLGEHYAVLVLSGPNAGGKTVAMKAVALAALMARAGMHVCAAAPARVDLMDRVLAVIGDEQDIRESLSTFSAHMANLAEVVRSASAHTLVVLDEIGEGTDPGEGAALAQAILEALADAGARTITTTHFNLLKEMAAVDERFCNASVEFDAETLAPTYRLRIGSPGASSATAVAARMGIPSRVIERAGALLEREDRRLDQILSELSANRVALEREKHEAERLRAESESARSEYRRKLERLQERRDELFQSMRRDLDHAFRDAHGQVAAVIRDLQRGGTARDAAHARERLLALEDRARESEREAEARSAGEAPKAAPAAPFDWRRARAGDRVQVRGGGEGVLEALPDRRGRVAVRVGSARVVVPADRVGGVAEPGAAGGPRAGAPARARERVRVERQGPPDEDARGNAPPASNECHVRGLRVEEALDRVGEALDRAAASGAARLVVVHGVGTGALRRAVRDHLRASPYVEDFGPAEADRGGEGVTLVRMR